MQKTIIYTISLLFALTLSVLSFTSPASAAVKTCEDLQYTGEVKTACEQGYAETNCNTFTVQAQKIACGKGAQQLTDERAKSGGGTSTTAGSGECGGAKTEILTCDEDAGIGAIASLIKTAIMIVTVLIGVIAVGGIAYAAILYSSARDNQSQVQDAVSIIRNIVIGLVMYGFTVAIINWLIPGGVIG